MRISATCMLGCALLFASQAQAATSFASVRVYAGDTDTTNSGATSASASDQSDIYVNNTLQSSQNANGYANLADGTLRAAGGSTFWGGNTVPGGFATVQFADTLYFTIAGAADDQITTIEYQFAIDGEFITDSPGAGNAGQAFFQAFIGRDAAQFVEDDDQNVYQSSDLFQSWNSSTPLVNALLTGSFQVIGASAVVPFWANLYAQAQIGYADFGNTAKFSFLNLPSAATFTSGSGVFLTSVAAVPLPAGFSLLAAGLGLLGFLARRKTRNVGTAPAA